MKAGRGKAAAPLRDANHRHRIASWSDAATIAAAAHLWLQPRSPWMARAKRELTAFSPQMVELGLRELFADIAANVEELERREAPPLTHHSSLITLRHILSGNLPNPGIVSIILGLLSGARNVVKAATGDPMPALFIESLAVVEADLAGRVTLTRDREAYRKANVVVAYGDDETIATLRQNVGGASAPRPNAKTQRCRGAEAVMGQFKWGELPSSPNLTAASTAGELGSSPHLAAAPHKTDPLPEAPPTFLGFGHRVSIGIVDFRQSAIRNPQSAVAPAARDVSLWDQQGCMSPQCIYVRGDGGAFAEALAREMERFDCRWPRAQLKFEDAAAIARARSEWAFRGRVWASQGSTHWTVVLDEGTPWAPSPLNRFVFVRPIGLLQSALRNPHSAISTVGFAGFSLKEVMGMARADRYCSLGEMQRPSLLITCGSRPTIGQIMVNG